MYGRGTSTGSGCQRGVETKGRRFPTAVLSLDLLTRQGRCQGPAFSRYAPDVRFDSDHHRALWPGESRPSAAAQPCQVIGRTGMN
jgi:hypothetical protein